MATEMTYLTDKILRRAVERQLEDEFDTHDIIFTLMTDVPREYVYELHQFRDHPVDPFVGLHTRIGHRLASKELHNTVRQLHRKRRSKNCRGKDDECEIWEKVERPIKKHNYQGDTKMTVSHEQIIEACRPILEIVGFHVTQNRNERRFITAYQIWFELRRQGEPICQELINECKGEYVGKGAGSNVGPAQKIAQALGNSRYIETQYLDTRFIKFNDLEPSGEDCGLFRLKS
ncbi:MAG: hypothetical protein A2Z38_07320 [Planctomycetes bacterium RBG_19FT_COMBO_48_8]|nr:MAG: hypothetical protein A2Z38_07320 [Planctomycetes bacterium RBG_19FT_COMBO_48_8]